MTRIRGSDVVLDTFDFLQDYVLQHFTAEQNLMLTGKYPESDEHMLLHNGFIRDIYRLQDKYERGRGNNQSFWSRLRAAFRSGFWSTLPSGTRPLEYFLKG